MSKEGSFERVNMRDLAADTLAAIDRDGRFAHIAVRDTLDMYSYLPARDRAFFTRLVYGTVERRLEIDFILNKYSKTAIEKQKPLMRAILRSAVYQILYMDAVPDSAACNEAVKLASRRGFLGLKGYVNGVLRNIAGKKDTFSFPESERYSPKALSIKYSMPMWIVDMLISVYGNERCESILSSFMGARPLYVWVDEGRTSLEKIKKSLLEKGITADEAEVPIPLQSGRCAHMGALKLKNISSLKETFEFSEGLISVQDISSMAAVAMADIRQGDFVLDVCAAPGGKSLHAAALLRESGQVEARDIGEEKISLIRENKERCRMENLSARSYDALRYDKAMEERADVVFADLPCSGLGVIGRKPDIKYRVKKEDIASLSVLQADILNTVCTYVKPGGRLVYSTCTLTYEENEQNVSKFLAAHPEFSLKARRAYLPDEGCDGFFAAAFVRTKAKNSSEQ